MSYSMKKTYIRPENELHAVQAHGALLESSNINVGGSGRFDVKEENTDWNFWEEDEE